MPSRSSHEGLSLGTVSRTPYPVKPTGCTDSDDADSLHSTGRAAYEILSPTANLAVFCRTPGRRMLSKMRESPDQNETWESYFGKRPRPSGLRSFKRQFALERKYTEKLFARLHLAIKTEIGFMEQRTMEKLEEIDASLNLIAIELARRGD